ncbi:hypothetical protein [Clostridium oryzae]|uniref:PilZ domain-containing protein n=1 Tax=Clostridium oryzae TaxID=1450648 RepID=A0A1V4II74_9CLOT|nr:hypothetical protein [Clostridium oryzae]OPJ59653.1 hypothetical protein CLORY_31970 [Clostridium oryzae]
MKKSDYSNLSNRDSMFPKERRIRRRRKYDEQIKIVSRNIDKVDIEVTGVDISIYGIGFISDSNFEKDDILEMLFYYESITIPAIIEVTHSNLYDDGFFTGGKFIGMQNLYREILREFLDK